ncbi:MAG: hypothetical protein GX977_04935 [Firmicutes bacterium]|nr:hypothetical protein [Bacillota bacterium]
MEGLISIIVILYVVASVIGAILRRLQLGPILEEPTRPAGPGKQQHRRLEEAGGKPRDVVVIGIPTPSPEGEYPTIGDGQEPDSNRAEVAAEEIAEESEPLIAESRLIAAEKRDQDVSHYARPYRPAKKTRKRIRTKQKSPYRAGTASEWRKAIILAEVLGKPRGLEPFRPAGRR